MRNWLSFLPFFNSKASAVGRAIVLMAGGQPVWTSPIYKNLAEEGYQANVTAFACIGMISASIARLPWVLYQKGASKKSRIKKFGMKKLHLEEIEEHALLNLLHRPNPFQGQAAFLEAATAYLLISGNSYIEKVGPNVGPPRELWTLRPDRIEILPDFKNMVGGYRYKLDTFQHDFKSQQIVHMKFFAPLDDWYGLSPMKVAGRDIDTDNEGKKWNFSLLKNSARPPAALVSEADLNDTQFARLSLQIQKMYSGSSNAGKPLLLEGGLDWKTLAYSPAEMDWLGGRKMSKREICQVFKVPPELIGDGEMKTYSNYEEARKAFYLETVLPLADRQRDDWNNGLTPEFGDGLYLDVDRDQIDAIAEDREKVFSRTQSADWLTVNEKRVATGYDEIEGGDVILVPMTVSPLGSKPEETEEKPDDV